MTYAMLRKGIDFRLLKPEQQHRAIHHRAQELYEQRSTMAQTLYGNGAAQETEEERQKLAISDWLTAEQDLRNVWSNSAAPTYFRVPGVRWGEYKFDDLTLSEQHLAIEVQADLNYRFRLVHGEDADWYNAAAEVAKTIRFPDDRDVRPGARANCEKRMAQQTESDRLEAKLLDWRRAEKSLIDSNCARLPVSCVPHLIPMWTYLDAA